MSAASKIVDEINVCRILQEQPFIQSMSPIRRSGCSHKIDWPSAGNVDILVNNAGITRDQLLMKMSEEDWDNVMDINVKSCYNTCRALVRTFLKPRKAKSLI